MREKIPNPLPTLPAFDPIFDAGEPSAIARIENMNPAPGPKGPAAIPNTHKHNERIPNTNDVTPMCYTP